jgi:hypothetical protein
MHKMEKYKKKNAGIPREEFLPSFVQLEHIRKIIMPNFDYLVIVDFQVVTRVIGHKYLSLLS